MNVRRTVIAFELSAALFSIVMWMIVRPQTVSAAEILMRAANVADLHSYEGVINQDRGTDNEYNKTQRHVWFQSPRSRRIEDFSTLYPGSAAPPDNLIARSIPTIQLTQGHFYLQQLMVSDGSNAWHFSPRDNSALKQDLDEFDVLYPTWAIFPLYDTTTVVNGSNASNLQSILDRAQLHYREAKLLGTETIAGRTAYKILLVPEPDYATELGIGKEITLWIDQETYIQLGVEIRAVQDVILMRSVFESIHINEPIDSSIFTFTPLATTKVVDARPKLSPTVDELTQMWKAIAQSVPFKVFVPTTIPAYLSPKGPTQAFGLHQTFRSPTDAVALTIQQLALPSKTIHTLGKLVMLGSDKAYVWEQFNIRQLSLIRDGTLIILTGRAEVTQDNLITIAESLQAVAK